jgi:DNA-directed RNA polymerase subunit RPC12/RpoP
MFCSTCGKPVEGQGAFCMNCGSPVVLYSGQTLVIRRSRGLNPAGAGSDPID